MTLELLLLAEAADGGAGGSSGGSAVDIRTTGDGDSALGALPDADSLTLDGVAAAEGAHVLAVLSNLNLLDDLTERSTVTGAILTDDSNLLSALAL